MRHRAFSPTLRPLALALHLACAALATTPALAQPVAAPATTRYAIPAGPLGAALSRFVADSGVFVAADARLTAGKASPGVQGSHTPAAALSRLLAGTGLEAAAQAGGSYTLRATPEVSGAAEGQTLGLVTVTAQSEQDGTAATVGYVAKRSAAGTKTDTPILEIPQTINVITADEITARGATSVSQALLYTPGLKVSGYTENYMLADETASRGFAPAPLYLDGAYIPYAGSLGGSAQIEPYSLERVEVFKGPASVLFGQNQPGGIINMVTKKPSADAVREVRLGVGSYGRTNAALDLGGALGEQQTLLYRVVAVANGGNQQTDYTKSQRLFVAPSLTWKPSAATSLTLYAQLQRDDGLSDYQALPAIGSLFPGPNGQRISRDFFNGDPHYNDVWRKQAVVGVDFSHRFNDAVRLQQKLLFIDVKDQYKGFYLRAFANDASGATDTSRATRTKLDWAQHNNVLSLDNNLEIQASTGAVRHTVLAGLDYRRFSRKYVGYNDYASAAINLYAPNYSTVTAAPVLTTRWDNTVDQVGLYLQDQMRWQDFVLTIGGRHDWAGTDNKDLIAADRTRQDDKAFTGRAGLTWLAGNGWAPYVSYSESFVPQIGTNFDGAPFKPTTGRQVEAGVKYQPPGSNALATFSVFDIRQQNVLTNDLQNIGFSVQTGEVQSRGAELEVKARLWKVLDIAGGLTYSDVRTTRSNTATDINRQSAAVPQWSAALWSNYLVQPGLSVGTGVRWTGSAYGDANNSFRTPAYAVFDAALRYDLGQIDSRLRGVEGSLTVQNLFDKTYISSCNYAFGCYYGKARSATANVTYRW
ncbi:TonB-dependent siderophore receptor [Xylophilus sp. GW821-FHT01B05]